MADRKQSPLQKAYHRLKKTKSRYCEGKAKKADLNKAAADYVKKAVAKGQTKKEATKKADRVKDAGCKVAKKK